MNESEATALNRAAQFEPQITDDELPVVHIGDALVFIYAEADENGRARLCISVNTESVTPGSPLTVDGGVCVQLESSADTLEQFRFPIGHG